MILTHLVLFSFLNGASAVAAAVGALVCGTLGARPLVAGDLGARPLVAGVIASKSVGGDVDVPRCD